MIKAIEKSTKYDLTEKQMESFCAPKTRYKTNAKQFINKKRKYCLDTCSKCTQLVMLKKIYWELRKLNDQKVKGK